MNVKPLQDMLMVEPELSRLGRQDISQFLYLLNYYYIYTPILSTINNTNVVCIIMRLLFANWQDNKKSLISLEWHNMNP